MRKHKGHMMYIDLGQAEELLHKENYVAPSQEMIAGCHVGYNRAVDYLDKMKRTEDKGYKKKLHEFLDVATEKPKIFITDGPMVFYPDPSVSLEERLHKLEQTAITENSIIMISDRVINGGTTAKSITKLRNV